MDDHAADVYRFLSASAPTQEVDDCFQETFIAALRAYPKLRDASNLRSWVLTIAARKVLDGHRARSRAPLASEPFPDLPVNDAPAADPQLWAAVRELPTKQRAAIVLRYVNQLRYREIAEVLNCTEAAARQSARAGLSKLKEVWR